MGGGQGTGRGRAIENWRRASERRKVELGLTQREEIEIVCCDTETCMTAQERQVWENINAVSIHFSPLF